MKTVKAAIKSVKAAPRAELVVRIPYLIILAILLWVFSIVASIFWVLQIIVVLLTGTRNLGLNGYLVKYYTWTFQIGAYLGLTTDERPPLTPL